ncbi:hypothetical protein FIB18_12315 [Brucella pecoris]|uniref:Uncharacterized protein n=1 Tax=Brucella pecoris TaxID=867683 RepID=A0A5C5CLP3_9HYPH|nr:hypothetical protein FIB18_12315 [Brucella pecoris]
MNAQTDHLAGATFTCRVPSRPACPLPGRSSAGRAFFIRRLPGSTPLRIKLQRFNRRISAITG